MSSTTIDQPREPRTLLDHLRAWWRARRRRPRPETPAPPPAPAPMLERVREYRTLDEPLVVLAQGDVYEFRVHADMTWSADGVTVETLRSRMDTYGGSARDALRTKAWAVARTCLPHHA